MSCKVKYIGIMRAARPRRGVDCYDPFFLFMSEGRQINDKHSMPVHTLRRMITA